MTLYESRYPRVAPGLALALATLLAAACADEPVGPLDTPAEIADEAPSFAVHLTCTVDVTAEKMNCDPSSPSTPAGGPSMNLIVGSQHQFVRMANDVPSVSGGVWSANVTLQNLTLQPMGTLDGTSASGTGVRVFFVDEPSNGVVVANPTGATTFLGSEPAKYYGYTGPELGGDGILSSGETSDSKTWEFELNGATEFVFSVLVSTEVPDPGAYAVRMTRVSLGYAHTCAEGSDGKLYCWGYNGDGELGDGTTDNSTTPGAVIAPAGVVLKNVSAGEYHTCAEGSDKKLYCWGYNSAGQLGAGTDPDSHTPVAVAAPAGVVLSNVSTGGTHTCAEGSDGKLYCWGSNWDGQLGDDTGSDSNTPVAVAAPAGVVFSNVSLGYSHTCAEGSDKKLYCWGANWDGQLGDDTGSDSNTPVAVAAPAGVVLSNASLGYAHTCAEGSDGKLYCWGYNGDGELGDGTTDNSTTPVAVIAPAGVVLSNVSAGEFHNCAKGSDGKLYCWGYNDNGQLGDGSTDDSSTPVAVAAPAGVVLKNVSVGSYHTCAEGSGGKLYCWGWNNYGQLGDGTTTHHHSPVIVAGSGGS